MRFMSVLLSVLLTENRRQHPSFTHISESIYRCVTAP